MTKEQREGVVELLRCAADYCGIVGEQSHGSGHKLWWAAFYHVGAEDAGLFDLCIDAERSVFPTPAAQSSADHRLEILLEAAQRVEDGDWP